MWYEFKEKINERFASFIQPKDHNTKGVSNAIFCKVDKIKTNEMTLDKFIVQG